MNKGETCESFCMHKRLRGEDMAVILKKRLWKEASTSELKKLSKESLASIVYYSHKLLLTERFFLVTLQTRFSSMQD